MVRIQCVGGHEWEELIERKDEHIGSLEESLKLARNEAFLLREALKIEKEGPHDET